MAGPKHNGASAPGSTDIINANRDLERIGLELRALVARADWLRGDHISKTVALRISEGLIMRCWRAER